MTENNKYGIGDLITSVLNQKPIEFEAAFNDILLDKLQVAVDNKKIEIAQNAFNKNYQDSEYEEE